MPDERPCLRVPEVAARLQVSPRQVYRLIAHGSLQSVRLGHGLRVEPEALTRFIQTGGTREAQR